MELCQLGRVVWIRTPGTHADYLGHKQLVVSLRDLRKASNRKASRPLGDRVGGGGGEAGSAVGHENRLKLCRWEIAKFPPGGGRRCLLPVWEFLDWRLTGVNISFYFMRLSGAFSFECLLTRHILFGAIYILA